MTIPQMHISANYSLSNTYTHTRVRTHTCTTRGKHSKETQRGQTGKEREERREMKARSSLKQKDRGVLQSERGWKHTHTQIKKKKT